MVYYFHIWAGALQYQLDHLIAYNVEPEMICVRQSSLCGRYRICHGECSVGERELSGELFEILPVAEFSKHTT